MKSTVLSKTVIDCHPVRMDRVTEDFIRSVFGVRDLFQEDAPRAEDLFHEYALKRFEEKYGRPPQPDDKVSHSISQADKIRLLEDKEAFRHQGYLFRRIGKCLVGISNTILTELKGDAPLGRAAETAAMYVLYQWQKDYPVKRSMEVEIDIRDIRPFYDPEQKDPNALHVLQRAVHILAYTTFCFRTDDLLSDTIVPLFKKTRIDDENVIPISLNEHFVGCLASLLPETTKLPENERQKRFNRSYFQDAQSRLLVRNLEPPYTRTQRNIQSYLVSEMGRVNDGWKIIRKGSVEDWIARLGYEGGNDRSRLDRFMQDIKRVLADAQGTMKPDISEIAAMTTDEAMAIRPELIVPTDFTVNAYAKHIEEAANIILAGKTYASPEPLATLSRGYTGKDMQELRGRLGIRQEDLAKAADLSWRQLIRIEAKNKPLKFKTIEHLWKALTRCSIRATYLT